MIIFKIYLDTKEINDKVNEFIDINFDDMLVVQSEYNLMNGKPINNPEWWKLKKWLEENDIDYDFWRTI